MLVLLHGWMATRLNQLRQSCNVKELWSLMHAIMNFDVATLLKVDRGPWKFRKEKATNWIAKKSQRISITDHNTGSSGNVISEYNQHVVMHKDLRFSQRFSQITPVISAQYYIHVQVVIYNHHMVLHKVV